MPQLSTKGQVDMNFLTDVIFRHAPRSDSVASFARKSAAKLSHFCDRIIHCRVVIDNPHHHHMKGSGYRVQISLSVPGRVIINEHDPSTISTSENLYSALSDAFESVQRQLTTYAGRHVSRARRR